MEAIILAGGKGTRLQSKVSTVPKPMAPVQEHPFLEYLLAYWMDQGIDHFVLSIGHLAAKISEHFGDSFRGCKISYSIETQPLGTGGGLLLALSYLDSKETALLLNGDSFLDLSLDEMKKFHDGKKSHFTLALSHVTNNNRYGGVETDTNDRCLKMNAPCSDINGGVYLFDPAFVRGWKPLENSGAISLEKDMIPAWLSRGDTIYGWKTSGRFIDIGTPEDYARAQEFFK